MFEPSIAREIFPIKIYEADFPNFESIQERIQTAIMPYFESPAGGNEYISADGKPMIIRTGNDLHKDPVFKEITDFIEFHGREYWKQCEYTTRVDPYILQMWANDIPPGGFTPAHNHNPAAIGGAFYINATPDKGNLYLEDPLEMIHGKAPRDYMHKPYLYTETITVNPGKLVIFPGWLRHHTRSNMTQENRYVLGYNMGAWINFTPKPTGQ
jgi:uncharacterized protein (TIGR02466 family)